MNDLLSTFKEKRYYSYDRYLREHYQRKCAKVILDTGATCPNRDGSKGYGGCIFCSASGSGDTNRFRSRNIMEQYLANKQVMSHKWKDPLYIPYFQSFSNTYRPIEELMELVDPFLDLPEVAEIAIATRCDCLSPETISYLDEQCLKKTIWLELGLQSSSDATGRIINRCHDFIDFKNALDILSGTRIKVCVHVMNGLPFEDRSTMLKTIEDITHLPFAGIKFHMLTVLKDTALAQFYERNPFGLLDRDSYIALVVEQLERLDPNVVIQRLTSDPLKGTSLAPAWVNDKKPVLNGIDRLMRERDTYQGRLYQK